MDITTEIKELFSDVEISEETINQMNELLQNKSQEEVGKLSEEIVALKVKQAELIEQHKEEIEKLNTEHESIIDELKEEAEAYGEFLQNKANEYGKFIESKADEYGDFLQEKANEYGEFVTEELAKKVDEYSNYVVENFINEHKAALLEQCEYERMKTLFENVKQAFEVNNFELNETVHKEVDNSVELKLQESINSYNKLYNDYMDLRKQLETMQFSMILENKTNDLTDTQKERVNRLIKNVSFASIDEFKRGVELIVEEVTVPIKADQLTDFDLNQEVTDDNKSVVGNDKMVTYAKYL